MIEGMDKKRRKRRGRRERLIRHFGNKKSRGPLLSIAGGCVESEIR